MKTKSTWLTLLLLVIVVIVIIVVAKKPNSGTDVSGTEPVKIGAILSLTGAGIQDAETIKQGIDFAVEDLKKKGANVEIIYSDDETDPKNTVSSVQFVKSQGAQAAIGFTWDFLYNSAAPVLDQQQFVGVTVTNTSEYSTPAEYGFFMAPKTAFSQELLENFFKENNIKNISFLGTRFSWSDVHFNNLKAAAANTGTTIVSEDWVTFGSEVEAITAVLPKIKAKNPDALFIILGGDQSLSVFFQRVQQNKLNVPMIAGTTTIGRYLKDNPTALADDYSVYSLAPRSSDKFMEYYRENHEGKTPGEYTEYAYDAVMVLYDAIIKSPEGGLLKDTLEQGEFKGFTNDYSFDENHDTTKGSWSLTKVN